MTSPSVTLFPSFELPFGLTESDSTCNLSLIHPGTTSKPLAFKVKVTHPKRYLVRPNFGVIEPGGRIVVQILMVEKDRLALLKEYKRFGNSAIQLNKDKFLIQSVEWSTAFQNDNYEKVWRKLESKKSHGFSQQKLKVRHVVDGNIPNIVHGAVDLDGKSRDELLEEIVALQTRCDRLEKTQRQLIQVVKTNESHAPSTSIVDGFRSLLPRWKTKRKGKRVRK